MFDFAWSELVLIGVVALVVIGPKDLPRAMRTLGFWVRRARAVAREFQSSVEQMVREAELEDVREQVQKATRFNLEEEIARHIDPGNEIKAALSDPGLRDPLYEPAASVAAVAAPEAAPPLPAASETPWQPAPATVPQPPATGPRPAEAVPAAEGGEAPR